MTRPELALLAGVAGFFLAGQSAIAQAPPGSPKLEIPVRSTSDSGLVFATLIDSGRETRLVVVLGRTPPDLANPSVTLEVRQGRCGDPPGPAVFHLTRTVHRFSPLYSSRPAPPSLGGTIPVPLQALRGSHAITLHTGPENGNQAFACANIA
jgi:hypothetical protein